MKSIYVEKRSVFVITEPADKKKISEAKFKLSALKFGYGQFDRGHYWSLPFDQYQQGYQILKSLFSHVHPI